jgi:3-hydroxyisobutyrate dehydrogenase
VLSAYADPILHAGATGAGQLVKLVNNTLFAAQIGLVAEATRLGTQFGIDESALLNALTHGSSQSRVLNMIAAAGSANAFIAAVGEFIGKDVAVVRRTVAELGGDSDQLPENRRFAVVPVTNAAYCERYSSTAFRNASAPDWAPRRMQ